MSFERPLRQVRVALTLTLPLLPLSCGEDEPEGFPLASDRCGGELCDEGRVFVGGAVGQGRSTDRADGGSRGDSGAADRRTVRGVVGIAVSTDLETVVALSSNQVQLSARGPDGETDQARYEPGVEFELETTGFPTLLAVQPLDAALGLMHTLQWIEEGQSPTQVLVMDRAIVSDLADNLAATPTLLDPSRGHAFLNFVDDVGQPLSEVSVTADDSIVAYDIGVFYTDAEEQTAERGSAVLLNAPASAFPGQRRALRVSFRGDIREFDLPIATDAVTLATIEL